MKKLVLAMAALAVSAPAAVADVIADGEKAFRVCASCHRVEGPDGLIGKAKGKTGPNLYGVPGRVVGSLETYATKSGKTKYKDGLIKAGEMGKTWDKDAFVAYIADPRGYIREFTGDPKAKAGMAAQKRADGDAIWAYLVEVSPAVEAAEEAPAEEAPAEAPAEATN
ncbi:MAG: cytochrome C [Pseudomonadota bacterium]